MRLLACLCRGSAVQLIIVALQLQGDTTTFSSENRIETLSARRVAWFVLVQLVRIALALFLGLGGVLFLSRTIGLEQLLRTTVALAFIRVSGRS